MVLKVKMAKLKNVKVWHKGVGLRVAFWHQPGCVWRRWLNHLVLVTAGGTGDEFEGFLGGSLKAFGAP